IVEQAHTSLGDLVMDIAERALDKLGAKVRSLAAGCDIGLPRSWPSAEQALPAEGGSPYADVTITQTAPHNAAQVEPDVSRSQGRLRAMGIEVPPEPEEEGLTAAQAAFVAAVAANVAAQQQGGTGVAEARRAAREIATIAGGGEAPDFRNAA